VTDGIHTTKGRQTALHTAQHRVPPVCCRPSACLLCLLYLLCLLRFAAIDSRRTDISFSVREPAREPVRARRRPGTTRCPCCSFDEPLPPGLGVARRCTLRLSSSFTTAPPRQRPPPASASLSTILDRERIQHYRVLCAFRRRRSISSRLPSLRPSTTPSGTHTHSAANLVVLPLRTLLFQHWLSACSRRVARSPLDHSRTSRARPAHQEQRPRCQTRPL
jgi:hypothetical protein